MSADRKWEKLSNGLELHREGNGRLSQRRNKPDSLVRVAAASELLTKSIGTTVVSRTLREEAGLFAVPSAGYSNAQKLREYPCPSSSRCRPSL